jgi:PLD-like domain
MQKWDPEYWFLGAYEEGKYLNRQTGALSPIPTSRLLAGRAAGWKKQNEVWKFADPKSMLSVFTSGNKVTPLVDGDAYVTALRNDLNTHGPGSAYFVLMAGWQFTNSFDLDRGAQNPQPGFQLTEVISKLATWGISTRVLAYDNPLLGIQKGAFVNAVNDAYPESGSQPWHVAYLDGIGRGFAFSHHQKEVFLGSTSIYAPACRAYMGGIDLAIDRWDTPEHRKTVKDDKQYGWHDIQVKVEGNAVQALWANFAERWGSASRVLEMAADPPYRLRPCPVPVWKDSTPGTQHVQVLRTVASASSRDPGRFMPDGEMTVLAGLAKAIRNAEHYIYIEEQFLWDCELADLISERLAANHNLHLIVVLAAESDLSWPASQTCYYLRSQFLMRVTRVNSAADIAFGPGTRVYVYGLYQALDKSPKAVYVHSKLIIIDDRYVSIGSANVDQRSMRIETELTLGIVDADTVQSPLNGTTTTVCKFAKDLRERLWKEHLALSRLPADPIQALQFFPGANGTYPWPANQGIAKQKGKNHARCYVNIPGGPIHPEILQRVLDRGERRWRSAKKEA